MKKLFIVDALNYLFRSYYAIRSMTNAKGESTNALFGFIRSIYKIMEDFSPDFIVVVFDGPDNKRSRSDLFAEYKSHRKEMPEDLFPQLEKAMKWCQLAGFSHLEVAGVEADDTIGSIATWAAEACGVRVYLCSSDKDLCQLVTEKIHLINPSKDNMEIDRGKVKELHGVTPEQMIDYLAIVGDASDNIPGLEGFGPKTASALLQEFGDLDTLLAHADKVKGEKKQAVLREGKEVAHLSRKLATIQLDVPFPKEEEFFHLKMPDMGELRAFYQEMNFNSLLKEMDQTAPKEEGTKAGKYQYHLVETEEALEAMCETLQGEKEICIDVETTDIRPMEAQLVGIGVGVKPEEAWYIPLNGSIPRKDVLEKVRRLLEAHTCFGHNIKYDLHALLNADLPIPRISFDTILASYLLMPQNRQHNLDTLTLDRFHIVKTPIEELIGKGKKQKSMGDIPLPQIGDYCCQDVDYTVRLKEVFEKELTQHGLEPVFTTIELPLIPVLLRMERRGIYVDVEKLKQMSHELAVELHVLEKKIHHLAGEEFNIKSPQQLSRILFDKLKISPSKKLETGYSTSADVLEELQEEHPLAKEVLLYRTVEKLRSTYVEALPKEVNPHTGRIHTTFNQSVAATGRLSSQNPNLQNIPIRSKEGKKVRAAFRPEARGWSFLSADYSQIELRLLAHLSEDPTLIKAFNEGEDIHAFTASLVFDVPLKEVTEEMRRRAKAVNFGILYGQQAFGLSQGLGIGYKEASRFIEAYFARYKRVKEYLEFCKEAARKTGRVVTMTGRHRPIPEILSRNPALRSLSERLAINTPLQGTAADLIKMAMIAIDRVLLKNKLGFMLLQIHDELVFECPDEHMQALGKEVKHQMESVMKLKVPLEVQISVGKNWGEC